MGIKIVDKREEDKTKIRESGKVRDFIEYLRTHKYRIGNPIGLPMAIAVLSDSIYKTIRIFPPKHKHCGFYRHTKNNISIETVDQELVGLVKKYSESNPEIEFTVTIRAEKKRTG